MSPKEPTSGARVTPPPPEQQGHPTPLLPGFPVELQPWFQREILERPSTVDDWPLRLANAKQLWRGHSFLAEGGLQLQEGQELADFLQARLAGQAEGGGDPATRAHAHASLLRETISILHLFCAAALNREDDLGVIAPSAAQLLPVHYLMFDAWVLVELLRWQRDASREDIQAVRATGHSPATFGSESGLTMHEAVWNLADEICRILDSETEGRLSIRPLAEQSLTVGQWLSGFEEAWWAVAKALKGRFPSTRKLKTARDQLKSEFCAARGHAPLTIPQGQQEAAQTEPSIDGNERAAANQEFRQWLDWLRRTPAPTLPGKKTQQHPDGVEGGCWLWWQDKRYDIPKGVVYRLVEFMWKKDSAIYDSLTGPVFEEEVQYSTVRARASEANTKVLARIGIPWRLHTDSVSRNLTKQPVS
jgi:hypothetical protein